MSNVTKVAIKPDVVGKRVKIIRTNNPYTDLKPGERGTVVDVSELPYRRYAFQGSGSVG